MTVVSYQRKEVELLLNRLTEAPRLLLFVAGPRQVGKTTLVHQVLANPALERTSQFIPVDQ
ncbi:MAG: hypothetical protein Q9M23_05215, partial [Mariprofundaceae bacterium]|nr:hypothetical protein [Mariprofundaceae bacterium]